MASSNSYSNPYPHSPCPNAPSWNQRRQRHLHLVVGVKPLTAPPDLVPASGTLPKGLASALASAL